MTQANEQRTITIIYGPTASGKSAFALDLAQKTNGVVINADAMQCYDALPILTAQPTHEEQNIVPHVLYGFAPPSDQITAQKWTDLARAEINRAFDNNQHPIITGGTGFYIKGLTDGFSPIPPVPDDVRASCNALQKKYGNPAFHALLAKKDPVMAEKLNPNDTHRLIHAYEVLEATGRSLSHWHSLPPKGPPKDWAFNYHIIIPDDLDTHIKRINTRFDNMMDQGVIDEVRALSGAIDTGDVQHDAFIIKAHGFRPLRAYLKGEISLDDAAEHTKIETRQYAKRQRTWARNQLGHRH